MDTKRNTSPAVSETVPSVSETQPPVYRVEFGSISAAIWSKQISSADGQPRDSWTVNLSRSYRDGKSTKRTHVLFPEHLLTASMALLKAWEFIEQKSKERTEASA